MGGGGGGEGGGVNKVHYVLCENGESLLIHLHKLL